MYVAEDVVGKAERVLAEARRGLSSATVARRSGRRGPHSIDDRLALLYTELLQRRSKRLQARPDESMLVENDSDDEDAMETNDECDMPLLAVLARRERLNVMRVSLYRSEYSLSLRSPDGAETESERLGYEERELLDAIDHEELPLELLDLLDEADCNVFYAGCVVCEVRDFRRAVAGSDLYRSTYVLLRPSQRTLLADLRRMCAGRHLSHEQKVELESQIVLATAPPLCLDPSPAVGLVQNMAQWSRTGLVGHQPLANFRMVKRRPLASSGDGAIELPAPSGPLARLHGFLQHRKPSSSARSVGGGGRSGAPPPPKRLRPMCDVSQLMPVVTAPTFAVGDVQKLARRLPAPTEPSRDCSLRLREENSVEWDRGSGRVMHMKLSVFVRPSDDSYHGQLYVDRDFHEGRRTGASCQFGLCCRAASELYVRQCIEIFTEYGKKSAKLTYQAAGHPARVSFTRGARERRDSQQQQPPSTPAPLTQQQQQLGPLTSLQQRLMRAQQQRVVTPVAVGSSALAAQLSRPPTPRTVGYTAAATAVRPQRAAVPQQQKLYPLHTAVANQSTRQLVSASPAQTIQIKVSGQSNQLTQMLQSQLQNIQVVVPAPAQQVTVSVAGSSLQALLSGPPMVTVSAAAATPTLLEKLVARTSTVTAGRAAGGDVRPKSATVAFSGAAAGGAVTQPSRAELQNPTLTELLNAPPAVSRPVVSAAVAAAPVSVPPAATVPPAAAAGSSDLLTAALQLVQNGELLAELENLESLLNEQQQQPTAAPVKLEPTSPRATHGRLLLKSEPPPPNVNIMNLTSSDGISVPSLQHVAPGLHNVQLSIPGLGAPISINVGAPQRVATAPALQLSPGHAAASLVHQPAATASFQLLRPQMQPAGAQSVFLPGQQQPLLLTTAGGGSQQVILTTAQPQGHSAATAQHVFLKPDPSGAGPPQQVIITSPPPLSSPTAGPQPQLLLSPQGAGGQRVIISGAPQQLVLASPVVTACGGGSVVQVPAGQLHSLMAAAQAQSSHQQLTPQQRAQLLHKQQQRRQAQLRKSSK